MIMRRHTPEEWRKAEEIFERLRPRYEPQYNGKMVAIDVDSGDHFIGETEIEAYQAASRKHPSTTFIFMKFGRKHPYFLGRI